MQGEFNSSSKTLSDFSLPEYDLKYSTVFFLYSSKAVSGEIFAKMDRKDAMLEEFVKILKDTNKTIFSLCLYPEYSPIEEAKRAYDDLKAAGINTSFLIVNYIIGGNFNDAFFNGRKKMQETYLESIKQKFDIPFFMIPQYISEINNQKTLDTFYSLVF